MPRDIEQDAKNIKTDLERLVQTGESMIRNKDNWGRGIKDLIKASVYVFNIYDEYKRLGEEIADDASLASKADKNKYFGETILEGAGCLGRIIIEKYVK